MKIIILIFLFLFPIFANDNIDAYQIIKHLKSSFIPNDISIHYSFTLSKTINDLKKEKKREIMIHQKFYNDKEYHLKSLINFIYPKQIKGTSILIWENIDSSKSYRSIFIPGINREKELNSKNKQSFMGLEFNIIEFYDILNNNNYHMLNDKDVNYVDYYRLKSKNDYDNQIIWVSKNNLDLKKIEFFNKSDLMIRSIEVFNLVKIDDIRLLTEFVVYDHLKKTQLTFRAIDYQINSNLSETIFQKKIK